MTNRLGESFICVLIVLSIQSCSNPSDERFATIQNYKGALCIKLVGTRNYMAHDPVSAGSNTLYKDSVFLPVPTLRSGRIEGKDIPNLYGDIKFDGYITIVGNNLVVKLFTMHGDEKIPLTWNGDYILRQ